MYAFPAFAAVLAALPFVAQTVFAADCARTYTVVEGDICDSISAKNSVSTYQLAVVNPQINSDCSNLTPGESLCLGLTGQDCTTTYVIQPNDDCDLVSNAHGLNTTTLMTSNPQIDAECSNLYIGEVLCVAGGIPVPPPPSGTSALPGATPPPTATLVKSASASFSATPAPTSAPVPSSSPAADDDDDDDDDLPWCDEL